MQPQLAFRLPQPRQPQREAEQRGGSGEGELFAIQNEVLLYDVTSTYFEGQAEANPLAQRGYSRDHRPDCKQVCIALVVTVEGFPLGYEVFPGNTHDSRTRRDYRGHDGGASRRCRARLDRRSGHGERKEATFENALLDLGDRFALIVREL